MSSPVSSLKAGGATSYEPDELYKGEEGDKADNINNADDSDHDDRDDLDEDCEHDDEMRV